jgi:hypothetical protein
MSVYQHYRVVSRYVLQQDNYYVYWLAFRYNTGNFNPTSTGLYLHCKGLLYPLLALSFEPQGYGRETPAKKVGVMV